MCFYWPETIKVRYHPAKFGGYRHSDSADVMVLFYHVISQEHVIKASCDFTCKSPSRQVTIVPSLVTVGTVVVEMILVFHVILQDQVI